MQDLTNRVAGSKPLDSLRIRSESGRLRPTAFSCWHRERRAGPASIADLDDHEGTPESYAGCRTRWKGRSQPRKSRSLRDWLGTNAGISPGVGMSAALASMQVSGSTGAGTSYSPGPGTRELVAAALREKEQGSGPIRPLRNLPALVVRQLMHQASGATDTALKLSPDGPHRSPERGRGRRARARGPSR